MENQMNRKLITREESLWTKLGRTGRRLIGETLEDIEDPLSLLISSAIKGRIQRTVNKLYDYDQNGEA